MRYYIDECIINSNECINDDAQYTNSVCSVAVTNNSVTNEESEIHNNIGYRENKLESTENECKEFNICQNNHKVVSLGTTVKQNIIEMIHNHFKDYNHLKSPYSCPEGEK